MTPPPYDKTELDRLYRCQYCGEWKVVPSLARSCERKHEENGERH